MKCFFSCLAVCIFFAAPNVQAQSPFSVFVDLDATTAGIQSTSSVTAGDSILGALIFQSTEGATPIGGFTIDVEYDPNVLSPGDLSLPGVDAAGQSISTNVLATGLTVSQENTFPLPDTTQSLGNLENNNDPQDTLGIFSVALGTTGQFNLPLTPVELGGDDQGAFTFFTLNTTNAGESLISFGFDSQVLAANSDGVEAVAPLADLFNVNNATLTVNAVPEPSSALLISTLCATGLLRRRRSSVA